MNSNVSLCITRASNVIQSAVVHRIFGSIRGTSGEVRLPSGSGAGTEGQASRAPIKVTASVYLLKQQARRVIGKRFQSIRAADSIVGHGFKEAGQSFRYAFNRRSDVKMGAVRRLRQSLENIIMS
jgi:hypothetical protein